MVNDLQYLLIRYFVYIRLQPAHQSRDDLVFGRDINFPMAEYQGQVINSQPL